MLESSLVRSPTSPVSNLSLPPVSLSLPINGDPMVPSAIHPCVLPPYSYSYLHHLSQQQSLPSPSPIPSDHHLKSYIPDHFKQYLPDHLKQCTFSEQLKQYFPEHLKQYLANEHLRNMVMNDPLRLYIAHHELATAFAVSANGQHAVQTSVGNSEDRPKENNKQGICNQNSITLSSLSRGTATRASGDLTTQGLHSLSPISGAFSSASGGCGTTNRLQESISVGGTQSGHTSSNVSNSRNSLFSIDSLLAPRNPPRLTAAPLPRPPPLDFFGNYIRVFTHHQVSLRLNLTRNYI